MKWDVDDYVIQGGLPSDSHMILSRSLGTRRTYRSLDGPHRPSEEGGFRTLVCGGGRDAITSGAASDTRLYRRAHRKTLGAGTCRGSCRQHVTRDTGHFALEQGSGSRSTGDTQPHRKEPRDAEGSDHCADRRGFSSINVSLRQRFDLFADVRSVLSMPGVRSRYEEVDLVIVRENTEGLYAGVDQTLSDDGERAEARSVITWHGSKRLLRRRTSAATELRRHLQGRSSPICDGTGAGVGRRVFHICSTA